MLSLFNFIITGTKDIFEVNWSLSNHIRQGNVNIVLFDFCVLVSLILDQLIINLIFMNQFTPNCVRNKLQTIIILQWFYSSISLTHCHKRDLQSRTDLMLSLHQFAVNKLYFICNLANQFPCLSNSVQKIRFIGIDFVQIKRANSQRKSN